MHRLRQLLRFDWPLHFTLFFTNWLPDNVIFLRFRGYLAHFFLGTCGNNFRLGRNIVFYNPSKVNIGENVYIAFGSWFSAGETISIGDEVTIGPYCVIASSNHSRIGNSYFNALSKNDPVRIDNGCWLGAHCVITAGCHISSGSALAAGAIVTGDIPKDVIAGGVPAKIIKFIGSGEQS